MSPLRLPDKKIIEKKTLMLDIANLFNKAADL